MRTSRYAGRRAIAGVLAGGAILGAVTACASSSSPAAPVAAATAGTTAPARTPGGPLAVLSGDQIITRVLADFKVVSSVHVAGSLESSGQHIALNLTLGPRGCAGTIRIQGEGAFVMLRIGRALWIKPDDAFWKHAAGRNQAASLVASLISGKYIKTSTQDSRLASLRDVCSPARFAGLFDSDPVGESKGTATIIAGRPALPITDAGGGTRAYVTVAAHPEFLRIDSSNGRLDFTRYNAPLHLTPPPAGRVLDGAKYGF